MTHLFVFQSDLVCVQHVGATASSGTWKLDKRLIRNTMVTEKQEGRDTLLISVFAKDYQNKDNREYDIYHLLKTQIKFLTDFNSRRSDTTGDLRMHIYTL